MSMQNLTVLITGSSKGLGKSIAIEFAKNKYNIILTGTNLDNLNVAKQEIIIHDVDCTLVQGDLTDQETIANLSNIAKEKNISILINNAAIDKRKPFEEFSITEIENHIKVNLLTPIKLTKAIYPLFQEKKSGIIININSIETFQASKYGTAYCASKFGLKGFTDSLRKEARANNIQVIGIYPTGLGTDMYEASGKERSKGMNTEDVAKIIFNASQITDTAYSEDIIINRSRYL